MGSEESKEQFGGAGPAGGETAMPGVSADELVAAKRAARKILAKCYSSIVETVASLDHLEEGIVNKQELRDMLNTANVPELEVSELLNLLKLIDRGQKGYVATAKFIDKLYELSHETEADAILRRIYTTSQHANLNLREELAAFDADEDGALEKPELKRGLKAMRINVSEADVNVLAGALGLSKPAARGADDMSSKRKATRLLDTTVIRIRQLASRCVELGSLKPLPGYVLKRGDAKPAAKSGVVSGSG